MIRPYREEDAEFLAPIHTAVFSDNPLSIIAFRNNLAAVRAHGGKIWIIEQDSPFGYALTVPVPGLPQIADLNGCIAPVWQGKGFGTRLLRQVLSDLQATPVRQMTHHVRDLDNPATHFLRNNGFYIEHEEWLMIRDDLRHLPPPHHHHKEGAALITFSHLDAVTHFERLYTASFSGMLWDQPYAQQEIASALENAGDILFLSLDSTPIGFAWIHMEREGLGVIEPLGILPEYQRQGYGRFLLLSTLHELARRGASRAQIGAWRTNRPAINLYQSLGFTHLETISYLAYDITA